MKHVKIFNEINENVSYKRDKDGYSAFYGATNIQLAKENEENQGKRTAAIKLVKENINASIAAIEEMPVTNWFEEPVDLLDSLYSIKEHLDVNDIV